MKTISYKIIPIILITLICLIIAFYIWPGIAFIESKYITAVIIGLVFFRIIFAAIFASIDEANSTKNKIFNGLIGTIVLSILFLIAFFYVVLTWNN